MSGRKVESVEGPGWVQVSEDLGGAMARKPRFRFGFADVFAGRLYKAGSAFGVSPIRVLRWLWSA